MWSCTLLDRNSRNASLRMLKPDTRDPRSSVTTWAILSRDRVESYAGVYSIIAGSMGEQSATLKFCSDSPRHWLTIFQGGRRWLQAAASCKGHGKGAGRAAAGLQELKGNSQVANPDANSSACSCARETQGSWGKLPEAVRAWARQPNQSRSCPWSLLKMHFFSEW